MHPYWQTLVPFNTDRLIQVANLWTALDTMKIKLYSITCVNVQFREKRKVVVLDSRYIKL